MKVYYPVIHVNPRLREKVVHRVFWWALNQLPHTPETRAIFMAYRQLLEKEETELWNSLTQKQQARFLARDDHNSPS